ncbi:hypothetical protein EK21DRAFT_60144 [Setomelanomma holmii]|uniref:CENP-V/GFA domain-containing protein n=1 Tax=Setomelanomma holmii TaxID=210430 RepID=A0A9P4HGE2_9PLEO|nr:hypothetical protein EK21DRAFT_60144 [Setomelanomma holmii]
MSLDESADKSLRTFHASCHCRSSAISFDIPEADLSLLVHFCHCSICRYTHGTLMSIHAKIPEPQHDRSTFMSYKSSEYVTKLFCSTCGAHMLDWEDGGARKEWFVAVSLVDAKEQVWDFRNHNFVERTADGGLAMSLTHINGKQVKLWKKGLPRRANCSDELHVQCHCGDIEFSISQPHDDGSFDGIDTSLIPHDKSRWYGSHDVCNSCRLVTSCTIVSWVFPTIKAITLPGGSPYPANGLVGTAKVYKTSEDVTRTFCSVCGATATNRHD